MRAKPNQFQLAPANTLTKGHYVWLLTWTPPSRGLTIDFGQEVGVVALEGEMAFSCYSFGKQATPLSFIAAPELFIETRSSPLEAVRVRRPSYVGLLSIGTAGIGLVVNIPRKYGVEEHRRLSLIDYTLGPEGERFDTYHYVEDWDLLARFTPDTDPVKIATSPALGQ